MAPRAIAGFNVGEVEYNIALTLHSGLADLLPEDETNITLYRQLIMLLTGFIDLGHNLIHTDN